MLAFFFVGQREEAAEVLVRAMDQSARDTVVDHEIEADVLLHVTKRTRQRFEGAVVAREIGAEIENRDRRVGGLSVG